MLSKFCAGLLLLELVDKGKAGISNTDIKQFEDWTCWIIKRRIFFSKIVIKKTKVKKVKKYTPLIFLDCKTAKEFLEKNRELIEAYL